MPAHTLRFSLIRDDLPESVRHKIGAPPPFLAVFRTPTELESVQRALADEPSFRLTENGWPNAIAYATTRARLREAVATIMGADRVHLHRELDELQAEFDALSPSDGSRSMVHGVQFFGPPRIGLFKVPRDMVDRNVEIPPSARPFLARFKPTEFAAVQQALSDSNCPKLAWMEIGGTVTYATSLTQLREAIADHTDEPDRGRLTDELATLPARDEDERVTTYGVQFFAS